MVPVVIPFYKNHDQLDKCVLHLKAQEFVGEIYIRDNSEDNILFTAAINEGIKHFLDKPDWEFLLMINQDMYLEKDALFEMVIFMRDHPKCGIGMPLQMSDESHTSFAGGTKAFPKGSCYYGRTELYWASKQITWASGGCMILRREMVQEIGLFDKNLEFIASDSDYSFTARARGWEVWCIPKAKGLHDHGMANTPDCGHELNLIKVKDSLYFAKKWLTGDLFRNLADRSELTTAFHIETEVKNLKEIKRRILKEMNSELV